MYDWLIVGAGFAGSVLAERLANIRQDTVLLIDRRPHVGGNAFDEYNAEGLLVHRYGPHIFHTNSDTVFDYLSDFTAWRPYEHRVRAFVGQKLVPIPINLDTVNLVFGLSLESPSDLERFLAQRAERCAEVRTSEDVVVSKIGRELYDLFFRHYTRKQWGLDPSQLDKSVTARLPVRMSHDDRYFTDRHQCMPLLGYTAMFNRMLSNPNIEVLCGVDYAELQRRGVQARRTVFTGPIDEYFKRCFGALPYRSLAFEHFTRNVEWQQPVAVVNYPQDEPFTRITEYKHLTGQVHPRTAITSNTHRLPGIRTIPFRGRKTACDIAVMNVWVAVAMTSFSWAVWPLISITIWIRWWLRHSPPSGGYRRWKVQRLHRFGWDKKIAMA
jgi:UDP-galactopyranose mutase